MINYKCPCIFTNFGSFVMVKLIPFDKIFENSTGVAFLLAKQSNYCSYYPNTPLHIFWRFCHLANTKSWMFIYWSKNIRELNWMSHGVMRFWFPLNFLFILAFFDILASLSTSRVFSRGFSGRWKSSCLDIPRVIIKFDYIN